MKKVRILTNVSDLSGIHKSGDEPELQDERADEYIASGIAETLEPEITPHEARRTAPESGMRGDPEEHATLPRARPRG